MFNNINKFISFVSIIRSEVATVTEKRLPQLCPSCQHKLSVKKMVCMNCETEVDGLYQMPTLFALTPEEQAFVVDFMKSSGSLKDMAKIMGLSYPTVRNYLDDIIGKLNKSDKNKK